MGLVISVYRKADGYDCTNGGLSGQHDRITVVNVDGPFKPGSFGPAFLIVDDAPCGQPYPKLVPAEFDDEIGEWVRAPGWFMFGGNYGGCSDSRFINRIIPIHDRKE